MQVTCSICGCVFDRLKGEVTRNRRLGRPIYCSRSCAGKANVKNIPPDKRGKGKPFTVGNNWCDKKRDEYTPFRKYMNSVRKRDKVFDLTLADLKAQWEKQGGICPYTGWKMLSLNSTGHKLPKTPNRASLDRKDSAKGYTKDNIQFVSLIVQYAKNEWVDTEVIDFCEAVYKYNCSQHN